MVALSDEWPAIPELRAIWFWMLGDFTAGLARLIESERFAGASPAGAAAQALAGVRAVDRRAMLPPGQQRLAPEANDASTPRGAPD